MQVQRSEILFKGKTSVVINFRKLQQTESFNSADERDLRVGILNTLARPISQVSSSLGRHSDEDLADSDPSRKSAHRATMRDSVEVLKMQFKSFQIYH